MKTAIKLDHALVINNQKFKNKICLAGVPIADYNLGGVGRLLINGKSFDVLDFQYSSSICNSVNVFYLIDYVDDLTQFHHADVLIDDEYFYQPLNEKATTDNLRYFQK